MPEIQITQSWLLISLTRDIQFSYEADFIESERMLSGNALEMKSLASRGTKMIHEVSGAEVRLLFLWGKIWSDNKKRETKILVEESQIMEEIRIKY